MNWNKNQSALSGLSRIEIICFNLLSRKFLVLNFSRISHRPTLPYWMPLVQVSMYHRAAPANLPFQMLKK